MVYALIGWIGFALLYFLLFKWKEDRRLGRSFFEFGDYWPLFSAVFFFLAIFIVLNILHYTPTFSNPEDQIAYGKRTDQPWLVTNGCAQKLEKHPDDPDAIFDWITYHYADNYTEAPGYPAVYDAEGHQIFSFFNHLSGNSEDPRARDLGELGLGLYYLERNSSVDYLNAQSHLDRIEDTTLKYRCYAIGKCELYTYGPQDAEPYFQREIQRNGYRAGAWKYLAIAADYAKEEAALKQLVFDPVAAPSIDPDLRRKVYYREKAWFHFFGTYFEKLTEKLRLPGLIGGFLILLVWLLFLRRICVDAPLSWGVLGISVAAGAALSLFAWPLYAFYHWDLGFTLNGKPVNDFLFCFLGIGVIEELIKLIPFLILLRFSKRITKPIHYLVAAAACGLGFAFFENMVYISLYGIEVVHSRALTASVSHMATSTLAVYGFMLGRFRYPGNSWWLVPLFFIASALAHGFYDFWLLGSQTRPYAIITLLFYLTEIVMFGVFLNNGVNQSIDPLQTPKLRASRLAGFLAGALLFVFTFEYFVLCRVFGMEVANRSLTGSLVPSAYLIFFLSLRFSNLTIVPGKWMPIDLWFGLFPFASRQQEEEEDAEEEESAEPGV